MTYFWAKTTVDGRPGISVFDHMLNVGYVARQLAEVSPRILERFQLQPSVVGALAALHDVGKICPGFQRKSEAWLEENGLTKIARNSCWDTVMESDHSKVSHSTIQTFLAVMGIDQKTAKFVSAAIGAHHGRLNPPNDRGYRPPKAISETHSHIAWDGERIANSQMIWDHFAKGVTSAQISESSSSLWWLAGLTSVADWIGSDERFFSPERRTTHEDVVQFAQRALDAIGFHKPEFVPDLSFHDLFHDSDKPQIHWAPNQMQEKTHANVRGPGVYVIEAPMGTGKTEAALWAAYQLLLSEKATGIYFALPTQATSNRMHLRMGQFVQRICQSSNPSRLIHSSSWLRDEKSDLSPVATSSGSQIEDARVGRDWFSSTKRALIAPFGVGTVDQALLGIVAAKHFFVRQFALAGKVVIIDEVHSYDLYTRTLIDKLITTLEDLGCTVIILSATLTRKQRSRIVSCPEDETGESELFYPLIIGRSEGRALDPIEVTPQNPRAIKVDFLPAESATEQANMVARNGGAVLWICNTVGEAQKQYRRLSEITRRKFPIGLLHSRFPFWRREELEEQWMKRFGKKGSTRCGSILVSTQVVEQSVDLDADFLITELAPTDMILQRLGRLWRHERSSRPIDTARLCIIEEVKSIDEFARMEPKAIVKALENKARVYAPFVLLRSLEVWKAQPEVLIPLQIRQLLNSTYEVRENEPASWQKLCDDWFGSDAAKKMLASRNCNLWQVALEDEEGVQTRVNEVPTIALVLCRTLTKDEVVFVDQSVSRLSSEQYQFPTAQAIHKNLVRVPRHCFDYVQPCDGFAEYLYGEQSVGIMAEGGLVKVNGLKSGTQLFYSDDLGLSVEQSAEDP